MKKILITASLLALVGCGNSLVVKDCGGTNALIQGVAEEGTCPAAENKAPAAKAVSPEVDLTTPANYINKKFTYSDFAALEGLSQEGINLVEVDSIFRTAEVSTNSDKKEGAIAGLLGESYGSWQANQSDDFNPTVVVFSSAEVSDILVLGVNEGFNFTLSGKDAEGNWTVIENVTAQSFRSNTCERDGFLSEYWTIGNVVAPISIDGSYTAYKFELESKSFVGKIFAFNQQDDWVNCLD